MGERIIDDCVRQVAHLNAVSLRYFNPAGAHESALIGEAPTNPAVILVPVITEAAIGKRPELIVHGDDYDTRDGTCIRDYIHISDLVSAHLLALDGLKEHDRLIYNLGSGSGYSVREVIETVRQVTGHPIPTKDLPRRSGDSPRLVASSDKIKSELGWKPENSKLQEIIKSAWAWHKSHPKGYED